MWQSGVLFIASARLGARHPADGLAVLNIHLDDRDYLEVVIGEQFVVLGLLCELHQLLEYGLIFLRSVPPQLLNDEPRCVAATKEESEVVPYETD